MPDVKHFRWLAYNSINGRILKHWRIRGTNVRNDPAFATINSSDVLLPEYEAAFAQLMAAAPELLAALIQAKDLIISHQENGCPAGPVAVPSAIWDAIAKATGEEQHG